MAGSDVSAATYPEGAAIALLAVIAYQGFAIAILGLGMPWIAKSFRLSQSAIAHLYAAMSLSALIGFAAGRMTDLIGRRRMLLGAMAGASLASRGAALSHSIQAFIACEILVFAFAPVGGACAGTIVAETHIPISLQPDTVIFPVS